MVRAVFTVQESLVSTRTDGLVGLNDLQLVETGGGTTLFATARGGGYLTGFDLGDAAGQSTQAGFWQISAQYLQLETTDLVFRNGDAGPELYLAGLAGNGMRGLRLHDDGQGPLFDTQLSVSSPGHNLSTFTELELFGTSDHGIAALRSGGLVNISFGSGNTLNVTPIIEGTGLTSALASNLVTTTHNGQTYAFASYGTENTVAMYRQQGDGSLTYVDSVAANVGLWVDRPGALSVATAADGGLYVVVAASGTDSLSVLAVTGDGMTVVDHVLDTRDTRFDNASHVTSVTIADQSYVLAAGADNGLSLFVMLPGGCLQHVETFEATIDAPLNGITALEAMAIPGGLRIWASTEAAPYLSEFSVSFDNLGVADLANDTGDTMQGTAGDDVLIGGDGADLITGGSGDDFVMDGEGADTLSGGAGVDTFVLARDGADDVIEDFDPLEDVLDLSGFGSIGGTGDIAVTTRSWGAELRFGDEVIDVRSTNGAPLRATDFTAENLIIGGRVEVDLSLYPERGTYVPEPDPGNPDAPDDTDNDGGGTNPDPNFQAQMPGAVPVFDGWRPSPGFSLDLNQATTLGTAAANNILTFGANNYIFGLFGNDTIRSGDGNDSVSGDGGNDAINSGNGSDVVMGGTGFDTIIAQSGADTIAGGDGADSILAGGGDDVILGGLGYDQIFGDQGDDSIWGGATADRLYGGAGNDFISAGSNFSMTVDGVWGEAGDDVIYGDGGFDFLDGGTGNDTIDGGAQADNLFGRAGADLLLGGAGLDRLFGGTENDRLYGGDGNDGHFGEWGDDTLWGGAGNDRFFGGSGADIIDGGSGNDTVYAGADFDTVIGGTGNDLLFGNFNADTFVFADFHGHDRIADFNAFNTLERIDLSGMTQIDSFATVSAFSTQEGGDVVIVTGVSSSIRLTGVSITDLDESDFIF